MDVNLNLDVNLQEPTGAWEAHRVGSPPGVNLQEPTLDTQQQAGAQPAALAGPRHGTLR